MSSKKPTTFHYYDDSPVIQGDIIKTGNVSKAVVLLIIQPESEDAEAYNCPEGEILIEVDWNGKPGLFLYTPPDGSHWEDLVLLSRKAEPKPGDFA